MVKLQRSFVETQSAAYVQRASASGGSQVDGSWSDLLRFIFAVTATNERSAPRSFAYASRRVAVRYDAPLSEKATRQGRSLRRA